MELDKPRLREDHRTGFAGGVVAEVELSDSRQGKDVVEDWVRIREFDGGAGRDPQDLRLEPALSLVHFRLHRPSLECGAVHEDYDTAELALVFGRLGRGRKGHATLVNLGQTDSLLGEGFGDAHTTGYIPRLTQKWEGQGQGDCRVVTTHLFAYRRGGLVSLAVEHRA